MTERSTTNLGDWGDAFHEVNFNTIKTAGNLPITLDATACSNNGNNSGQNSQRGIFFGLTAQDATASNYDVSTDTKLLLTSFQFNAPNRIQVETIANEGIRVAIGSSSTDYKVFKIGGNDTPMGSAQAGAVTICIDLNATGNSEVGNFDNKEIERWGWSTFHKRLQGGNSNWCYFQRVYLLDTTKNSTHIPKFTGTSNWNDAFTAVQGTDYTTTIGKWLSQVGSAYFVPCPLQFGDGSTATNFDDGGVTIVSPADNATNSENFRLTNQAMRVYLNQRDDSSDNVTLSGSYFWNTPATWDFDESNNASCSLTGSFNGMGDFSLGASVTAPAIFNLATGAKVICNGANINNATISGDCQIKSSAITTFTNLEVGGSVDFDTAGTYILDNCTFGGATNSSGGSVTLKLVNGSVVTSFASNVTINADLPWSIEDVEGGSRLQIFNVTKNTEIENIVVSGTGKVTSSGTYNASDASVGDFIRLRIAKQDGLNAFLPFESFSLSTSVGISFRADQSTDLVYEANAINADTLTTLTADYPNVQIDINEGDGVADVRELYAFFVKQMTSATGIQNWFGAIDAIDRMNYRVNASVADIKLQNTGSIPLIISGARIFRDDALSILHADNGDKPMTQDNGELVQFIKGQVSESLDNQLPPAVADAINNNATIDAIDKNSKLIPALL